MISTLKGCTGPRTVTFPQVRCITQEFRFSVSLLRNTKRPLTSCLPLDCWKSNPLSLGLSPDIRDRPKEKAGAEITKGFSQYCSVELPTYLHQRETGRLKAKPKQAARERTERSLSTSSPPPMTSLRESFEQKYRGEKSLEFLFDGGSVQGCCENSLHILHCEGFALPKDLHFMHPRQKMPRWKHYLLANNYFCLVFQNAGRCSATEALHSWSK